MLFLQVKHITNIIAKTAQVNDVVTDCSYALTESLVSMLFDATFHIANVFY